MHVRTAALAALLAASSAHAYDRAREPVAVAVARADAVVVGTVTGAELTGRPFTTATVAVERSLLGDVRGSLTVDVDQHWQVGQRVVLLVQRVEGKWRAVLDGTGLHTPTLEAEIAARIAAKPAWSEPVDGWSVVLVTEEPAYPAGAEIDAYIVYRNASESAKTLQNREWPPAEHTFVDLVVSRDARAVEPRPHPHVTKAEIEDYFSKHANHFEIVLAPGEAFALVLQRIDSAKPGWGYKERLGFRYWPMDEPGTYTVAARDPKRGLATGSVTVEIR